jgi:hypothetical protein
MVARSLLRLSMVREGGGLVGDERTTGTIS